MALFRGTGGSGDASTDTYASEIAIDANKAVTKANEAAASATSAATAQAAAEAAQAAAETAQTNAETAETNAETAETNAETAETAAEAAKSSAETAKTAAETAKTAAETAKTAAETAETNAETAETNAATSATNAATSETNAATSATTATTKASEASTSATSAATSATTATTKASEASTSATNAATSATSASTSKTAAETAKTAAETAKTAAETAQTAAETAQTAAETAETNASASATTATTKASEASTSATNASTSATTATTKASEASTSATNAATSATAAAASATSAQNAKEAIDGLYLGTATSNPTVDGNGNAVTAGDWYFNTTDSTTRIYDGSAWNTVNPDLVGDSTPQLGGDLDLNSSDITGTGNLNITGNISLSGTVDGRDVATDGTKLDGIESGATADQTAAEIRTLVDSASDSNVFTDADHTKLDGIETSADVTDTTNVVAALTAGTNVTIAANGTISSTDTNTQLSNEQVQDIVGGMVTGNTESGITVTYQDADGTIDFSVDTQSDENFTSALKTKLDGIETGATGDQTNAEIRAAVEAATDSNVFTDADHTKLNGIEASADVTDTTNVVAALTAGTNVTIAADGTISSTDTNTQLSNEQVQDIVGAMVTGNTESGITVTYQDGDGTLDFSVATQSDQNFTSALKTKLDGIEASADVTDTTNVVAALTAGTNVTIAANGTISSTDTNTQLSTEQVQDIVGAMFSGNTETRITATYQDGDGTIDLVVDDMNGSTPNNATITISAGDSLTGGGNFTTNQSSNETITINHQDTSSQASVNNSGNTVIQDVTLDTNGHVTGLASTTLSIPSAANNATITISAGTDLTGGGNFTTNQSSNETITINHEDVSSQGSVNNSNGTVIQDVTLNANGHVTALGSVNLDGRYYTESESDSRFVNVTGDTMTGQLTMSGTSPQIKFNDTTSGADDFWIHINSDRFYVLTDRDDNGSWDGTYPLELKNSDSTGHLYGQRLFAENYHPNADKWTTSRTLSLTGAVTGSVSWDGSGNASLATTATSDPTLTLSGDVTGSATFTNLGNATLTATVANDSHNHSSSSGNFTVGGALYVPQYIYHNGDINTYIELLGDRLRLFAGGVEFIDMTEGSDDNIDFGTRARFNKSIWEQSDTLSGTSVTINFNNSNNFVHDLTGNTTYTFSNPPATGHLVAFTLKVIQDSTARTITWPSSVDWVGGTAPTLSTANNAVDVFVFFTHDGGTTYYGFVAGQDMK